MTTPKYFAEVTKSMRNSKGQFLPGQRDIWLLHRRCRQCDERIFLDDIRAVFCSQECSRAWHGPHRTDYKKLLALWEPIGYVRDDDERVVKCEVYIEKLLPKYGFTDILNTRQYFRHFVSDILCRMNDQVCCIEATFLMTRPVKQSRVNFCRYFRARLFVAHVKPTMDWYCIKEVPIGKVSSSTCRAIFRAYTRGEGKEGVFAPISPKETQIEL